MFDIQWHQTSSEIINCVAGARFIDICITTFRIWNKIENILNVDIYSDQESNPDCLVQVDWLEIFQKS